MRFLKILAWAVLMAPSVPVYGGAKETAARAAYEEATTAYNLAHFEEAAQQYEAAYKLVHDPNMLFNIAQSFRLAGKLEQALPIFRSFLREAPAESPNRPLAERFVEELKRKIEENKAAAALPARPPAEAKPAVEPAPAPAPVAVPAHGTKPGQFVVSDSLIVTDTITGLVWQRDGSGTRTGCSGSGNLTCTWAEAKAYCASLTLGGLTGWRLPGRTELLTILDRTKRGPAIDQTAFPSTPSDWFWTSSPLAGSSSLAWSVNFNFGYTSYLDVSGAIYVRCVR